MKSRPSPVSRPFLSLIGAAALAASLIAGPGIASAVTPQPTVPPVSGSAVETSKPATGTGAQQTTPAAPAPSPSATPTAPAPAQTLPAPAPVPAAPSPEPTLNESMADVLAAGGAEMGQRSARVTAKSSSARLLRSESLSAEGTWMPTFGVQGLDVSGHQPSVDWNQQWNMGARFAYVKATEGNVLHESVLLIPVPGFTQRRDDPRRLPLRHPQLVLRRRAGPVLRPERRRLVSATAQRCRRSWTSSSTPTRAGPSTGSTSATPATTCPPRSLASWVRDFGNTCQVADRAPARHLHQHLMVEPVPRQPDRVRRLPPVGCRLPQLPDKQRRRRSHRQLEHLQHLAVQQHRTLGRRLKRLER